MFCDALMGRANLVSRGGTLGDINTIGFVDDIGNLGLGATVRHLEGAVFTFADGHAKWFKGFNSKGLSKTDYTSHTGFKMSLPGATFHASDTSTAN